MPLQTPVPGPGRRRAEGAAGGGAGRRAAPNSARLLLYDAPREAAEAGALQPSGFPVQGGRVPDTLLPPPTGYPLLFTGVLRCRYEAIKTLFEKKFGAHFRLLGVDVLADRWYVYVKTLSQAAEVILRMDKLPFHGGVLCVRYLHPNGSLLHVHQVNRLIEQMAYNANAALTRRNNGFTEFSAQQLVLFGEVFDALHKLPHFFKGGVPVELALRAVRRRQTKPPAVLKLALREHSMALAALCLKGKVLQGHCLLENKAQGTPEQRRQLEACQSVPAEPWEPFRADAIDSPAQLVHYMKAMLAQFGPLCVHTDLRLRLATFLGQVHFQVPATARELVHFLERLSPQLLVLDDVLYDATLPEHRRVLREHAVFSFARSADFSPQGLCAALAVGKPRTV